MQGFANAVKWVKEMKETEEELKETISYLSGFVCAFRDQIHTDIQVKPGNDQPSIPAHRALLVRNHNSSLLPQIIEYIILYFYLTDNFHIHRVAQLSLSIPY